MLISLCYMDFRGRPLGWYMIFGSQYEMQMKIFVKMFGRAHIAIINEFESFEILQTVAHIDIHKKRFCLYHISIQVLSGVREFAKWV